MASPDPIDAQEDEAIRWAAHAAHGGMTAQTRSELEAWLEADRRHRGAFLRAQAMLCAMEDIVVAAHAGSAASAPASDHRQGSPPSAAPGSSFLRNARAFAGAAAIAASIAALVATGVLVGPRFWPARPIEVAAPHVVDLKDGSRVTLRNNARIDVALADDIRRITLISGEATFKVAKDRARPFVVRSGDVYAQATGTIYSVARTGALGATVAVIEGRVLVWPRDERDQAVLLRAGESLTLSPRWQRLRVKQAALPKPEVAQIALDDVTIATAAARFNRINEMQIILEDPAIGEQRIIGLFEANHPERFAQAAAAIADAEVVRHGGSIIIKSKKN